MFASFSGQDKISALNLFPGLRKVAKIVNRSFDARANA